MTDLDEYFQRVEEREQMGAEAWIRKWVDESIVMDPPPAGADLVACNAPYTDCAWQCGHRIPHKTHSRCPHVQKKTGKLISVCRCSPDAVCEGVRK